ncbi:MAG TPA: ABC-type transport auxiliary lipoprotein family protein [Syntrophales bacterium]|nr:ABC-type transport auxiliary lipoprotein family protein [Syntrophales bacterium]HOL58798.1 ABC-type transport auxiliary lipoprotein family protein [Syntrophales bacterium]HPO35125.1 ABC-type transport auxiliary lipoprotein family protein [Syntrophales bacterium]
MKKSLIAIFTLSVIYLLSGCLPSPAPPPSTIRYYTIDYPPPAVMKKWESETTLKLEQITSSPPFDAPEMIWQHTPYSREISRRERWQARPETMVANLLLRDLRSAFPNLIVFSKEDWEAARFVLEGKITEFLGWEREGGLFARVALMVTLFDTQEKEPLKRTVLQKSYEAQERLSHRSPLEMARGTSLALERLNRAVLTDLDRVISQRLKP